METNKKNGLGVASFVLGIIGVVLSCVYIGIIPCLIGLILGIIALSNSNLKHGIDIAGIALSAIGIMVFIILMSVGSDESSKDVSDDTTEIVEEYSIGEGDKKTSDATSAIKKKTDVQENENETEIKELSIESEEIYNGNNVQISTSGVEETSTEWIIKLIISNESEKDYSISAHTYSINGLMAGENLYGFGNVDIPSGKKANLKIEVEKSWLKDNEIDNISEIEIIFWAYYDNFKEWDTGQIKIQTNFYEDDCQYVPDGENVLNDENVELWYIGGNDNKYLFSIKNNSNYNAGYTIENCSVNGWAYDITNYTYDLYDEEIHSGAYSNFELEIDDDFLDENEISEITDIEFDILLEDDYWNFKGSYWKYKTEKVSISK